MKVVKRYNQHRRDLTIDLQCENCGNKKIVTSAYDDTNYWVNVVPNMRCSECEKTSKELGSVIENIGTKYPEGYQI